MRYFLITALTAGLLATFLSLAPAAPATEAKPDCAVIDVEIIAVTGDCVTVLECRASSGAPTYEDLYNESGGTLIPGSYYTICVDLVSSSAGYACSRYAIKNAVAILPCY